MEDMTFYTAIHCRSTPCENDINGGPYSTYEEAKNNLPDWDDYGRSVLTQIKEKWYRVSKQGHELIFKAIWELHSDWHTLSEIESGLDLNSIPFKDLIAMAAISGYCSGHFAKNLGIAQKALYDFGFYEKFTEFFGKPMYEFKV